MKEKAKAPPEPVNAGEGRRGRKPANESRAAEFRASLIAWRQTPGASRISLRALAAKMDTSHQLLSFYLRRLHMWEQIDPALCNLLRRVNAQPGFRLGPFQGAIVRVLAKKGSLTAREILRKCSENRGE